MTDEPIRHPIVRSYREQIADAVQNLRGGHTATFTIPGYAITCYLRELDRAETSTTPLTIYATWYRDHLTGELRTGEVLRLSVDAGRRAAAMAYAFLENLVHKEK